MEEEIYRDKGDKTFNRMDRIYRMKRIKTLS
jgi:hypothetical protein